MLSMFNYWKQRTFKDDNCDDDNDELPCVPQFELYNFALKKGIRINLLCSLKITLDRINGGWQARELQIISHD